jgi:long-chain acyl-CoA synthetase
MLRYWAVEKPEHPATRSDAGEVTFAELNDRATQVAGALEAAGVGSGDRVAFLDKNSPEQIELFFGAAKRNAVPCPINFRLAAPEIEYLVRDSEAKVFAVGEEFWPTVEKVAPELPGIQFVIIGAAGGAAPSFAEWREAHGTVDRQVAQAHGDVAYQLYSSGTTGRPKGVQLTQANLLAGFGQYDRLLGFNGDAVTLVAMPLYHIGGGGWALLAASHGATSVLVREIVPPDLVALIERERITHAFLVPAVLQFLLAVPGVADRDFSALRSIFYGASPISERVLTEAIKTFGCGFAQAYGLTETTGTVLTLPEEDHQADGPNAHRLRSVGVPSPGTEVKVADAQTGEALPEGTVGELWVRGPTVMAGYWKLPDETAQTIDADGWLRTGDAGYTDGDGYFYVYDRVKDMIVSGGENIYPAEIENVLMSHPDVADAAVIGVPDDTWGETPKALVVRTVTAEVTADALRAFCREHLAGFKVPSSVEWRSELPRNPSGKILKRELREPYWEHETRRVR